jgi:hypothetical protein
MDRSLVCAGDVGGLGRRSAGLTPTIAHHMFTTRGISLN